MKKGIALLAPASCATRICGLTGGLLPPTVGCAWQIAQPTALKRGPRPALVSEPKSGLRNVPLTESTSTKVFTAAPKAWTSPADIPGSGPPARAAAFGSEPGSNTPAGAGGPYGTILQ